jgi:DNA polymerase V
VPSRSLRHRYSFSARGRRSKALLLSFVSLFITLMAKYLSINLLKNLVFQKKSLNFKKIIFMDGEHFYGAAYRGSKQFSQQDVRTANATGFGAAADDYAERGIDLNEQLIRNKPATFFFRMKGDAMTGAGIFDGDVLIVDRSLKLADGKVIVAILNGELLIRRYHKNFSSAFLISENERFKSINLAEFNDFALWGVVVYSIHQL